MKEFNTYFIILFAAMLISCSTTKHTVTGTDQFLQKTWHKTNLSDKHHMGLLIYDPEIKETLLDYRADNYFIPASNAKILTLYAALQTLEDSLKSAIYVETKDSIFLWGGGDPGTLYPNADTINSLVAFLKNTDKAIVISNTHFQSKRYGPGWAWDDYPYNFQCERNALPAYGNRIWIERHGDSISIQPTYLSAALSIQKGNKSSLSKSEWGEAYSYTYNPDIATEKLSIPITFFENDTRYTWAEITGKNINYASRLTPKFSQSINGSSRDSLLKILMHESDNFVAEQILLACSMRELQYMSDTEFIHHFTKEYLFNLQYPVRWFDGSGLSRYNAMTPTALVDVLERIYQLKGKEYITAIFPAGGQSGTIKDFLSSPGDQPYIYAKSGTMKNVYCLSGYLMTRSGKVLLFSWMNNNFNLSKHALKSAMEKYLLTVYNHY